MACLRSQKVSGAISAIVLLLLLSFITQEKASHTPTRCEKSLKKVLDSLESERKYPTPAANSSLLPLLLLSLAQQKHSPDTVTEFKDEYDYIIIGAGTAGSVMAGRLSEVPCASILLLEAGGAPPLITEVPGYSRTFWGTDIDWKYHTAPQKHTGNGLPGRRVYWPSGKALGGSSIINAGLYLRGNHKNYNDWAEMGAVGWNYDSVLPYFKKLEDNLDPEYVKSGYHAVGGPVTADRPQYTSELKNPIIEAATRMGHILNNPNGATQTGLYDYQFALRRGQRCSMAKAYLVPSDHRPNLDILPHAMVKKIVIENKRATGVQFDHGGCEHEVKAKSEVILTAGAINSAQLLMLSGVGPADELKKHKIPVLAELSVGLNLQDHPLLPIEFLIDNKNAKNYHHEKLSDPNNIMTYIRNRTGPLEASEGISLIDFVKTDSSSEDDIPAVEVYHVEGDVLAAKPLLTKEYYEQLFGSYEGRATYQCATQLVNSRSKGSVRLNSSDPYDPPIIDPNYLEDKQDMEDVVSGMKYCLRIARSEPMVRLGIRPFETVVPGCEQYANMEDKYLRCVARAFVITTSHQVGTAKMGNPEDKSTVVDPELRVKSIKGLRVADASVMPLVPYSNTNIPTAMVAEKAADIIKSSIGCYSYTWNDW